MNLGRLFVVAGVVVLGGCASASQTYGPDGRPAYSLNCSGAALTWGACEEKAGSICGKRGYDVISRSGDSGVIASPQFLASTLSRTMLVECRK